MEGGADLDEEDRVEAIAAVLPLVPAERAVPLAGRVLDAVKQRKARSAGRRRAIG